MGTAERNPVCSLCIGSLKEAGSAFLEIFS